MATIHNNTNDISHAHPYPDMSTIAHKGFNGSQVLGSAAPTSKTPEQGGNHAQVLGSAAPTSKTPEQGGNHAQVLGSAAPTLAGISEPYVIKSTQPQSISQLPPPLPALPSSFIPGFERQHITSLIVSTMGVPATPTNKSTLRYVVSWFKKLLGLYGKNAQLADAKRLLKTLEDYPEQDSTVSHEVFTSLTFILEFLRDDLSKLQRMPITAALRHLPREGGALASRKRKQNPKQRSLQQSMDFAYKLAQSLGASPKQTAEILVGLAQQAVSSHSVQSMTATHPMHRKMVADALAQTIDEFDIPAETAQAIVAAHGMPTVAAAAA